MKRRAALQLLGAGAAALATRPWSPLWAGAGTSSDDFFIFIHAAGGWDVTLWADPRNETKGLVVPASKTNTDVGQLGHWTDAANGSFEILAPGDSALRFGPGIGNLFDHRNRLTIFNGIAMNSVSHEDAVVYSLTGRHRTGGSVPAASIDVVVANELGRNQLMPDVAIKFGSHYVGDNLGAHAIPLRVTSVEEITRSFARSDVVLDGADRSRITALLTDEARQLAGGSTHPEPYQQLAVQHAALPRLLGGDLGTAFDARQLQAAYPQFNYKSVVQGNLAVSAAFAVEAIKRNFVRCVSFNLGGLDTHGANYRQHAHTLQELFGTVAIMLQLLDATPHPTRRATRLSERTHIVVLSDFCRTPQINMLGGRDHYPNNSALVISPRFRGGRSFGRTDDEQLLPVEAGRFTDGRRAITPADVLATFLGAFAIDPRRYMRDGEIIRDVLV
ncbi:MAG: DUF1501 domain-containing protein [Proteobacteria bacterium]|nr:DUF1501 domain-containing protein [Pseudomonadota bacterium]